MPKVLRYLLIIIAIILAIAGIFAAFIAIRGIPHYTAEKISLKVEPTLQRIERGQVLVSLLCRNCHFDPNTNKLTGREMAGESCLCLPQNNSKNKEQGRTKKSILIAFIAVSIPCLLDDLVL